MNLRETLRRYNFSFSKRYGQNFISEPQLLHAIASAGAQAGDTVVEVGAGAGTLTAALCDLGANVTAFEIDERLRPVLEETLAGKNASVIFADVMKYDISNLDLGKYRVVANLPYYITTPVIFRFLYDAKRGCRADLRERGHARVRRTFGSNAGYGQRAHCA